jgi:hypothetical protein
MLAEIIIFCGLFKKLFSIKAVYHLVVLLWIDTELERSSYALIKVAPQQLPGRTEENHEKPQSG